MAFDFASVHTPFRMQPGLRRLAAGQPQLTPNEWGSAALTEKLAVLTHFAHQALVSVPGFDATPAMEALVAQACLEHPGALVRRGATHISAPCLGWSVVDGRPEGDGPTEIGQCLQALAPPWRLAGLLCLAFAEDFALIDGDTAQIPWLAVCLPSHWAPLDKVGRHFAQVHSPVADNQMLLTASEHLARLVTGSDRWERFVWTITPHGRLDAHPQRSAAAPWPAEQDADAPTLAAQAFWRTEHQTFIPLHHSRQALFTIHVEVQPLTQALALPERAQQVHDALASMSDAVLVYRNLAGVRQRLLHWLQARAQERHTG